MDFSTAGTNRRIPYFSISKELRGLCQFIPGSYLFSLQRLALSCSPTASGSLGRLGCWLVCLAAGVVLIRSTLARRRDLDFQESDSCPNTLSAHGLPAFSLGLGSYRSRGALCQSFGLVFLQSHMRLPLANQTRPTVLYVPFQFLLIRSPLFGPTTSLPDKAIVSTTNKAVQDCCCVHPPTSQPGRKPVPGLKTNPILCSSGNLHSMAQTSQ